MVAKISSGSSLFSALAYNQNKIDAGKATVLFTNNMLDPRNGDYGIGICTSSFEPYLLANNRTVNPVIHISVNPDPKDNFSDEQFTKIAEEYMQKLGYGKQPYIVYKHQDIDREHIHIVSVKVDETGKMIRDNFQHRLSMRICRELERKYNLIPATEKEKAEGYSLKTVAPNKGDIKRQIANVVRTVVRSWHFQSFNEFKTVLSYFNVHVTEVKGEHNGVQYTGIVYSAQNKKGEVIGNPINSSRFGKTTGNNAIQKRIEKSKEAVKNRKLKERPKEIISKAMHSCKSKKDFEKQLAKEQITVVLRENESGRIYGVTFIDHKQNFVFNGSRLGKEFSANAFHGMFNENSNAEDTEQSHEQNQNRHQEQNTNANGDSSSNNNYNDDEPKEQYDSEEYNSTESIENSDYRHNNFNEILPMGNRGENPEEEAFIRRMRRKKKRNRKL